MKLVKSIWYSPLWFSRWPLLALRIGLKLCR